MALEADSDTEKDAARSRRRGGARTRRCIVTGEILSEARLLRFVAGPDGEVMADVEASLPGRGLWLKSDSETIERAIARKAFSRAAKAELRTAPDLASRAERRLADHMLSLVGLARRSGEAILGFEAVDASIRGERPPAVVIEAAEAAADGRRKLQGAALKSGLVPFVVGCFLSAELGLALGRANVIHAALKPGRMAERFIFNAGRIAGFRPLKPWIWAGFSSEAALAASARDALA
jgi:hypothetical protein